MGKGVAWTDEETERLREGWGQTNGGIPALAKRIGRSVDAVKIRAQRLGLGPWTDAGEHITLNQLYRIVSGHGSGSSTLGRWQELGLPVCLRQVNKNRTRMVRIEDFWRWARRHREDVDFSRFEAGALGAEPKWAARKRAVDEANRRMVHPKKCAWTAEEEEWLRWMIDCGATYADLERGLKRSTNAIRRKIYDLYLPPPRRAKEMQWTEEDHRRLAELIESGYSVDCCAAKLGRPANSTRARVELMKRNALPRIRTAEEPEG